MSIIPTTNLQLSKFTQGTKPWDAAMNQNMDAIDGLLYAVKNLPLGPVNEVVFSTAPVFDLSKSFVHHIVLNADVVSSSVTNLGAGLYIFVVEQDSVGNHAFVFPSNFKLADPIGPAQGNANQSTICVQSFVHLTASSRFIKIAPTLYG